MYIELRHFPHKEISIAKEDKQMKLCLLPKISLQAQISDFAIIYL